MGLFISDAYAAATTTSNTESLTSILMMLGIFAVFYLMIIRPQTKRAKEHRELIGKIKGGDEVSAAGGVIGEIVKMDEQFVTLSLQQGVEMMVQRSSISAVLPKGTIHNIKKSA